MGKRALQLQQGGTWAAAGAEPPVLLKLRKWLKRFPLLQQGHTDSPCIAGCGMHSCAHTSTEAVTQHGVAASIDVWTAVIVTAHAVRYLHCGQTNSAAV